MLTINDVKKLIEETSAEDVVKQTISKAKGVDEYHALLSFTEERALMRAKAVDSGDIKGQLAGVPFVAKDNFLAFGGMTTAASKILEKVR